MHRRPLQVYLDPRQLEMLRAMSTQRNQPMTHLIRESLERYMVEEMAEDDPLLGLVGMISSDEPDTAVEHDRVIATDELARIERGGRRRTA